jgi:hypothetical protein
MENRNEIITKLVQAITKAVVPKVIDELYDDVYEYILTNFQPIEDVPVTRDIPILTDKGIKFVIYNYHYWKLYKKPITSKHGPVVTTDDFARYCNTQLSIYYRRLYNDPSITINKSRNTYLRLGQKGAAHYTKVHIPATNDEDSYYTFPDHREDLPEKVYLIPYNHEM